MKHFHTMLWNTFIPCYGTPSYHAIGHPDDYAIGHPDTMLSDILILCYRTS
ncbi:hypothetical protein [Abyssalbus ytuae]|uniref:Uncharacterized protein n=1 Tax=Abyssalbus ytuae TaxID=2926907 RepID=A0A9E6ZLV6_9FLAO|nr:hypothetical protein [Abyssalbus ytuae]UOB18194.1 hypothetical protein MQE35_02585 [Abyssalbus ytuae]